MPNENEYQVEGYAKREPYDSDYHPSAEINPSVHYAFGGNPELQEKWQEDLTALKKAKDKQNKKANRPVQEAPILAAQRNATAENLKQQAAKEKEAAEAEVSDKPKKAPAKKAPAKKTTAKKTTTKKTAVKKA